MGPEKYSPEISDSKELNNLNNDDIVIPVSGKGSLPQEERDLYPKFPEKEGPVVFPIFGWNLFNEHRHMPEVGRNFQALNKSIEETVGGYLESIKYMYSTHLDIRKHTYQTPEIISGFLNESGWPDYIGVIVYNITDSDSEQTYSNIEQVKKISEKLGKKVKIIDIVVDVKYRKNKWGRKIPYTSLKGIATETEID